MNRQQRRAAKSDQYAIRNQPMAPVGDRGRLVADLAASVPGFSDAELVVFIDRTVGGLLPDNPMGVLLRECRKRLAVHVGRA